MQTLNTQFESELTRLIAAEIETIKDHMAAGAFSDISEYKRVAGQIYAYRRVVQELAPEANRIITER